MRRPTKIPVRTRERYILDSLSSIFKGGEWVQDQPISEVAPSENYGQTLYVTVIGGQKYDKHRLNRSIPPDRQVVVGAGRGVESDIAKNYGQDVYVVQVNPELYGKNARKVNVEEVLSFAPESPLLLVGSGTRVKQARDWLKRARWPREVIELP